MSTRRISKAALACSLGLSLALSACGPNTSVPQPVPVPAPKIAQLRVSAPDAQLKQEQALVVGLSGAVDGVGTIEARELISGATASVPAAEAGTFGLRILAPDGYRIRLRYLRGGEASAEVELVAARPNIFGRLDPTDSRGGPVSAPDENGLTTLSNHNSDSGLTFFSAPANTDVLLINEQSGALVQARTDASGHFAARIPAQIGDAIQVVGANEQTQLTNSLVFTVPAS
jgi:hypothetical protein